MRMTATVIVGLLVGYPLVVAGSATSFAQTKVQQSQAEADFTTWLDGLKSSGVGAKAGSVAFDASRDTLVVKDLTMTSAAEANAVSGTGQLRVGTISINAFAFGEDGYRFNGLTADDISTSVLGDSAVGSTIKHLAVGKSFLPTLAGFSADPKKPVTSQIRLLSLLARMTTDGVEVTDFSTGSNLQIKRIGLNGVGGGTIGSLTTTGVAAKFSTSASDRGAEVPTGNVAIDEASASNISLDAYIRLFDESAYLSAGAARPWSNLIDTATLNRVSASNGPMSFTARSVDLGAFKVRQFPDNITSIFDAAARDPAYLQSNPGDAQKLANSVRQSFMLSEAHLSDFKLTTPNKGSEATVAIGTAKVSNLSATHLDNIQVSDASISDLGGVIALRALQLDDVVLPSKGSDLISINGDSSAGSNRKTLPTVGNVVAEGFDVNVGEIKFGLDKLQIAMSYFIGSTPTAIKMAVEHVKFPVAQVGNAGLKQTLTDLGYENVDLSADLSGAWQDSASALAFDTIKVSGASMGSVTLSGSVTGITRQSIENPAGQIRSELMAGGLQNFRLSFENDSLFDRFISKAAKVNNRTPEDFKKLLSSNMPAILGKISSPTIRNKFVFAAVSFLNTPNKLEFSASTSDVTPIQNVLAALQNPSDLPVVLKLDVSANDRK